MYYQKLVRGRNVPGTKRNQAYSAEGQKHSLSSFAQQVLGGPSGICKRYKVWVFATITLVCYFFMQWGTVEVKQEGIDATVVPVIKPFLYTEQTSSWGEGESVCNTGKHQSPINIETSNVVKDTVRVKLSPTCFVDHYTLVNKGFQLLLSPPDGQEVFEHCMLQASDGRVCKLAQAHMHTSSEHLLNGNVYDMEAHLVHFCDDGTLAVYGLFFNVVGREITKGPGPQWLDRLGGTLFEDWSETVDGKVERRENVNLYSLVDPNDAPIYTYDGSLTTPPCSEIVTFFLQMNDLGMSHGQYKALSHRLISNTADSYPVNNRKCQPLNDRVVHVQ
eukprot:CFRG7156T1